MKATRKFTNQRVPAAIPVIAALCLLFTVCSGSGGAKITGGKTDKTELAAAITTAKTLLNTVALSDNDGAGLEDGAKYTAAASYFAFEAAVVSAEEIYTDSHASQAKVDEETAGLKGAVSIFQRTINTVGAEANNKPQLDYAIKSAEQLLNSITVSEIGSGLEAGAKYVSSIVWDAFEAAINTALDVYEMTAAVPTAVTNAITALNTAKAVFSNSIKTVISPSLFRDGLEHSASLDLTVNWFDWWATGFSIHNDTPKNIHIETDLLNLPPDGYFRVEFENLGNDWPDNFTGYGGASYTWDDFIRFIWKGPNDESKFRINILLEGFGPVVDGRAEVFMKIDQFIDYVNSQPGAERYIISYGSYRFQGGNDPHPAGQFPTMVVTAGFDSDNQPVSVLTLEVWVPES